MQCPNCQMNVKDDAQFCIHCGAHFENQGVPNTSNVGTNNVQQPVVQSAGNVQQTTVQNQAQPMVGSQEFFNQIKAKQDSSDKYYREYLGSNYDNVMESRFSFGTFFFGIFWLLGYKLYSQVIKLILTQIAISIAVGIIGGVLFFLGLGGLVSLLSTGATFYVSYLFGSGFARAYLERATRDIDRIINTTTDEDERMRLCKKKGGPSIIIFAIEIAVIVGMVIFAYWSLDHTVIDNEKKSSFADIATAYYSGMVSEIVDDNVVCGEPISKVRPGIYYYNFTTKTGDSATKLYESTAKSPWNNADLAGQIIIYKRSTNIRYSYAVVLVDEEGRGIGEFDSNLKIGKVNKVPITRSMVEIQNEYKRKSFFEKVSAGTPEALKYSVVTADTDWDGTKIKDLVSLEGEAINSEPVACEIIN